MSLAFISYAREDREAARRLARDLKSRGINTWMDEDDLLPGQDWKAEISKAVRASDYFILLLSSNSVSKRGYVQRELRQALEVVDEKPFSSIFLIPVRLHDVLPPSGRLQDFHWLDMFPSWERGVERLLQAIKPEVDLPVGDLLANDTRIPGGSLAVSSPELLEVSPPAVLIAWDPEVLDQDEYVELVTALGDLVRAEGGAGIERLNGDALEVVSRAGVFV
jgi:hypothetical protein